MSRLLTTPVETEQSRRGNLNRQPLRKFQQLKRKLYSEIAGMAENKPDN
jgi:hypothetical protein